MPRNILYKRTWIQRQTFVRLNYKQEDNWETGNFKYDKILKTDTPLVFLFQDKMA